VLVTLAAVALVGLLELRDAPRSTGSSPMLSESRAATSQLRGAPGALAALRAQAGRLLGPVAALRRRLASLRGYPVVLNVWASWCPPCRSEFPLLARASARYGGKVAFLGMDADDEASEARSFLAGHPVGYPSYEGASTEISFLAPVEGLPSTIFLARDGALAYLHVGQYESLGTLETDIERYALGGAGNRKAPTGD
jgi:cytochrome c biogenesis protein CcmG, thiol:disulfide interchange protein DsbE